MVWPLAVSTTVIPLTHNPTAFREDGIGKARTTTRSAGSSRHINSSALNENSIDIGLAASNNLTNCNAIRVDKDIPTRESKSLLLEVIMALRSCQFSFSYERNHAPVPPAAGH
jgi:hypothetical protein